MSRTGRHAGASLIAVVALGIGATACSSTDSSGPPPSASASATAGSTAQDDALDAYVAAAQDKIPQLIELFDDAYADITIEAIHPGTVHYRYVTAQQVDADAARAGLKKQVPTLQSSCDTALFPAMAQAGITTGPRIRYEYDNADGSTLMSYTCEPS
jgi:hypothetical protein